MAVDITPQLLLLFIIIFGIIAYLIILNILKFIMSFRFVSKLIKDFQRANKKYLETDKSKKWTPWRY